MAGRRTLLPQDEPNLNDRFSAGTAPGAHKSMTMSRFAAKSPEPQSPPAAVRSGKLLSLLIILETLRQEPVPMRPQKA